MLVKSILSRLRENPDFLPEEVASVTEYMISILEDDILLKNIFKSYQFFDIWKDLITNPLIKHKMLKS